MTGANESGALGRESQDEAVLIPGPADRLTAALDMPESPYQLGDALPYAWHWMYFLSAPPLSALGSDGRGGKGELLPAFEGLNRMWAGGALTFQRPLRIGARVQRQSKVVSLEDKQGRSGRFVLASVEHRLSDAAGVAQTERHDIVFRERKPQSALPPGETSKTAAQFKRTLTPDEVLLFRFSALTYNSHRIHYDWPYTTKTEGYPGLIVHGPLTALLLLNAIRRSVVAMPLVGFEYRAVRPMFCGNPMTICAAPTDDQRGLEVWAEDHEGFVAMRGKGQFG
jgi:3-methylfumaryl-CoA hydratase